MTNTTQDPHSPAWALQVWLAFAIALLTSTIGILYLPLPIWPKAFLGLGFFFTVAQSFTLAKTVRDQQESKRLITRITEAKAEKILREFEEA